MTVRPLPASWLDEPVPGRLSPEDPGFSLPVGTVTFLLTDVCHSTRAWEQAPDAMATAIARHYELLDDAIAAHAGVRPVEQGEGDSVVGAFARASDAVAAALDAQRAFATESWPDGAALTVRMALHTGEAELRDEGNYFGPAVIRCARLRSIAAGGQVLVSGASADLVHDRLPAGATLSDLGLHRLKDLGRPEHVWELRHADLHQGFAPLRSLDNLPNNLPVQLTSFVGRSAELAELRQLLNTTRLLAVNGAGGCGKTRLALQLGAEVLESYSGGAWLVELAPVIDPTRVAAAIASALGERELTGDLVEVIASHVRDRPTLIVLDNCEHLLAAVATLVDALLRRCPELTIVATSREPLGVPGETAWRVPSLPAPEPNEQTPFATLSQYDAVRLFLDRATKARPNFNITEDNAAAIAQICHRLDGIPLAVELAAARVRGMTVEQVAEGLDDRFRLLTGGARTVLPRQQTLQASVDWSYELLSDRERSVFRRLGVFAGGFTLDAAEQVVATDDIDAVEVLDLLVALVDKSIIDVDDTHGRYRMLETLRQYAATRLVEAGETARIRDAHLRWAATVFDMTQLFSSDRYDVEAVLDPELDNLRGAFEWSISRRDVDAALNLATILGTWESRRGDPRAGIAMLVRALELPDAPLRLRLFAMTALAWCHYEAGEVVEAATVVGDVVPQAAALDDADRAIVLFAAATSLLWGVGAETLRPIARDAIAAAEAANRPDVARNATGVLALAHCVWGDWREGEQHAQLVEGDPAESMAALNITWGREVAAYDRGNFDEARKLLDLIPAQNPRGAASIELVRLQLDLALGTDSGAIDALEARLLEARRRGFTSAILQCGWAPAVWRVAHGDVDGGARELDAWVAETGAYFGEFVESALLAAGRLAQVRNAFDENIATYFGTCYFECGRKNTEALLSRMEGDLVAAERIAHEGLEQEQRYGYRPLLTHALETLAGIAAAQESYVECARLAGAAQALRDQMGYVLRWPHEEKFRIADFAAAVAALGEDGFKAAFDEGRALDADAAVAYAQRARGERKRPTAGWLSLTPTEMDVVRLVAAGQTNKEVGAELLMGAETVKTHLSHVYDKLGIRSRAALATEYAARQ
jgi:predicted ATPase/class 3 adenylate cyclase/DNA-binding CsgD family transcriptional regulator